MAFDQDEFSDTPSYRRLQARQLATANLARQRDMGYPARATMTVRSKASAGEGGDEPVGKSAQAGRWLAAARPKNATLRPEAETVKTQFKGVAVYSGRKGAKHFQLCCRNRTDERQRQMQRGRARGATTFGGERMTQCCELRNGLVIRPKRKKDAMRMRRIHLRPHPGEPAALLPG